MKKIVIGIVSAFAFGAGVTWSAPAPAPKAGAAQPAADAPAEKPNENPLHLSAAQRDHAGLALAKPTAATLAPVIQAFGRVLDPTPLIALVAEAETARAALAASEKDATRVKKLYEEGTNVSAQVLETAEAAAARDRIAVASVRARLLAGWGRTLADGSTLEKIAGELAAGSALLRIDVLPGDTPAADLKNVSVGLTGETGMIDAMVFGPAPVADPQLQGPSFLAAVHHHTLPVGAELRVTLAGPGAAEKVLLLPRPAIVYHQGSAWIYVLGEEDTFERKLVTLGRTTADQVAVVSGLDEGDQVVTTGAGQLLSAELQAGGAAEEP
jgi:hypothetical protein